MEIVSTGSNKHESSFEDFLQKLQCQFLSCYPLYSLEWEDIPSNLTWEQQKKLLDSTVGQNLNRLHPIKLDYQLNFLKRLIQILEKNSTEVHDNIYNEYCRIQQHIPQACTEEYIFKHYIIPRFGAQLTMREAKSFVGKGTTGLCTWQASLALTDYLLHNPEYVKGKSVIELGAGTGLCGLILMLCNAARQVTLTDGSEECVTLMRDNIKRNFAKANDAGNGRFELSDQKCIDVLHLPWEKIEGFQLNERLNPNLLLAADVVYDDFLFDDLVNAIDFVFKKSGDNIKMLLAATVRNEETLEQFLKMVKPKFDIKDCALVPEAERYLHWDRMSVIRILEITRRK